jgi:beta-ribofuranosylaminobenzene 5'-phosphate synthase
VIQLKAYSRLHFGFLNPLGRSPAGLEAPAGRCFGGVGLMIAQPDLLLCAEPAPAWSAEGPLAERALAFAQRFAAASCRDENVPPLLPHRLRIERVMPPHAGLGSGTQLGLSVGRALAASWELSCDVPTLARRVGRGLRSALGTHGFEHGGFLVESGKLSAERLSPLVARQPFPEVWRLVVAIPTVQTTGLHGRGEIEAFARLPADPNTSARIDVLCRLVLLGMLPALVERDVDVFGEALYEFNVRVGEAFAPVQGGVYASPQAAELVKFIRAQGHRGAGQSSWGPAVFAVVADTEHAEHLAVKLRQHFNLPQAAVWTTPACNHGAILGNEENHHETHEIHE